VTYASAQGSEFCGDEIFDIGVGRSASWAIIAPRREPADMIVRHIRIPNTSIKLQRAGGVSETPKNIPRHGDEWVEKS